LKTKRKRKTRGRGKGEINFSSMDRRQWEEKKN